MEKGFAQPYTKSKTRHRFAFTYVGLGAQITPSSGVLFWEDKQLPFPSVVAPRFTIGGIHFWGHVDFNMNIPLSYLGDKTVAPETEMHARSGGDLSARLYPWRIEYGKVRPFLGIGWNEYVVSLRNEGLGSRTDLFVTTSLLTGVSFAFKGYHLNAEFMWMPNNSREFYSSRTDKHVFQLPKSYFSLSLVKHFEGTLREEKNFLNGKTKELEKKLSKENKLNSFSIGIAPSGSYFLQAPKFGGSASSLPRHTGVFNMEYSIGYLVHQAGFHAGLTFREFTSQVESFGFDDLMRRRSLALEAFWFFWDYNGFVPFIGPTLSFERWASGRFENDVQQGGTQRTRLISPGIIFGWDILASPLETWVLRTNLRYYPFQKVRNAEGKWSPVDQFEFNFIQLVVYPSRIVNIHKAKKAK